MGRPKGRKDSPGIVRKPTAGSFKPGALDPVTEPGDTSRFLTFMMDAWDLQPVNKDNPVEIEQRMQYYFAKCIREDIRPGVEGLCLYLGIDRTTFYAWGMETTRGYDGRYSNIAKKARQIIAGLMEEYMQTGKINPVSGIFLLKNHFGYQDKQEVVVSPKDPASEGSSPEEIKARYIESVVSDPAELPAPGAATVVDLEPVREPVPLPGDLQDQI